MYKIYRSNKKVGLYINTDKIEYMVVRRPECATCKLKRHLKMDPMDSKSHTICIS